MHLQPIFSSFLAAEVIPVDCNKILKYCVDLEKSIHLTTQMGGKVVHLKMIYQN